MLFLSFLIGDNFQNVILWKGQIIPLQWEGAKAKRNCNLTRVTWVVISEAEPKSSNPITSHLSGGGLVVSNSYDPMNCSLPGSSIPGILQARILEWVAISFSRGSSWPRNQTRVSCIGGRFFTNWAVREAQSHLPSLRSHKLSYSFSSKALFSSF